MGLHLRTSDSSLDFSVGTAPAAVDMLPQLAAGSGTLDLDCIACFEVGMARHAGVEDRLG